MVTTFQNVFKSDDLSNVTCGYPNFLLYSFSIKVVILKLGVNAIRSDKIFTFDLVLYFLDFSPSKFKNAFVNNINEICGIILTKYRVI